ncbi:hypothetical protein DB345_03030 [Spartobacteria bacterium LR76]|nr:hypothetical protein DB345_03030 [Spartobacteria bacterium LR76]
MRRLDVSATGVLPATVPKRFVKLLVGLFLLPAAWVLTQTFFMAFARTTIRNQFWITEEFWFFSLGVILWLVAFFGLPRPIWLYVFGHELTHAIWVMLMGGRVHRFQVTRQGGHILADRTNTWIALAPYFFPLYSLLAILVYGVCGIFWDVAPYRWILYMVIGITWAFHLTFTVWMITKGQPDLYYGGTFFSLTVIYILNLILLSIMLVLAAPEITWLSFLRELFQNTVDFTSDLTLLLNRALR